MLHYMNSFPELSHLKRHAKHISKKFRISLSYAKEIVAFMHNCSDWAELRSESTNHARASDSTEFSCLPSPTDLIEFKKSLSPYIADIRNVFDPSIHIPGSILDKVVKGNLHHLPGNVVQHLLYAEPIDESQTIEEVIYLLNFLDDTFSNALAQPNRSSLQINIRSSLYGHRLYGYCDFVGKKVHILCREWDLELKRPSNKKDNLNRTSICTRPWFKDYMIGYLKAFIDQCRSSGYTGTLKITRIQNAYVGKWANHEPDKYRNTGLESLFETLSSLPGTILQETHSTSYGSDVFLSLKI